MEVFPMLFCVTANYTPKGLQAMAKNPSISRRDVVEELMTAAGGKLVAFYGTIADGPGGMSIVDIDPSMAPAYASVIASFDGLQNVRIQRLFTDDEAMDIRQKSIQLQASFRPPGQ
jgi:uncharacterized protein with GYD domain